MGKVDRNHFYIFFKFWIMCLMTKNYWSLIFKFLRDSHIDQYWSNSQFKQKISDQFVNEVHSYFFKIYFGFWDPFCLSVLWYVTVTIAAKVAWVSILVPNVFWWEQKWLLSVHFQLHLHLPGDNLHLQFLRMSQNNLDVIVFIVRRFFNVWHTFLSFNVLASSCSLNITVKDP